MLFIILLVIFFAAVVIHEYCHGLAALFLGDKTAKISGRLTLNPLAHIDLFGTIILPLALLLMSKISNTQPVLFGWAKPVPINFAALRNPKRDIIWVGMAGPFSNMLLGLILSFAAKNSSLPLLAVLLLKQAVYINFLLAVFNLIPIPPLDGSRIVMGILPKHLSLAYSRLERYGFIILIALLYLSPKFFAFILTIVHLLANSLGININ